MEFRFTLDPNGSPLEVANPIGWDKAKIVIKRDRRLRGVFINYITDLEFVKDAFDFIQSFIVTNGLGVNLDIRIERKCADNDPFEDFYDGQIYLSDVTFDIKLSHVKTKIEDNSLTQLLLRRRDMEVTLDSGSTLNGNALSDIETTFRAHAMSTGSYDFTGIKGFILSEVWQYVISYLTDNEVTFESDHFQTNSNELNHWRVTFDADFNAGNTITFKYSDVYGIQYTLTQAFDTTHANTISLLWVQFVSTNPEFEGLIYGGPYGDGTASFPYYLDSKFWTEAEIDTVARTYNLFSYLPFTIDEVTITGGGAVNATILEVQEYTDGAVNYMLTNGLRLWDSTSTVGVIRISLQSLFDECNKMFNLGLSIVNEAGTRKLIIEKNIDLFEDSVILTIDNVDDLEYKFTDLYLGGSINVGSNSYQNTNRSNPFDNQAIGFPLEAYESEVHKPQGWSTSNGAKKSVNAINSWVKDYPSVEHTALQRQQFDDFKRDKLYIVEAEDVTASPISTRKYIHRTSLAGSTFLVEIGNVFLRNTNQLFYWLSSLTAGSATNDGRSIANPDSITISKLYSFKYPLSKSDLDIIIADPGKKINFSRSESDHVGGFIEETRTEVLTGLTEFKLLAE